MVIPQLQSIVSAFDKNVSLVTDLMNFDREVQDHAIRVVQQLLADMDPHLRHTEIMALKNSLALLTNVRTNDSLRPKYRHVRNQCVVLLVSYFAAATRDLFVIGLNSVIAKGQTSKRLAKVELKLTVAELSVLDNRSLPDLLIDKTDISFQDMGSIARAFATYLDVEIARDQDVGNIIVSQACRHALVHSGGVCDREFLGQVKAAGPNNLDIQMLLGEPIELSEEQIDAIRTSMVDYVTRVSDLLPVRLERRVAAV